MAECSAEWPVLQAVGHTEGRFSCGVRLDRKQTLGNFITRKGRMRFLSLSFKMCSFLKVAAFPTSVGYTTGIGASGYTVSTTQLIQATPSILHCFSGIWAYLKCQTWCRVPVDECSASGVCMQVKNGWKYRRWHVVLQACCLWRY